jgi:phosphoglycolate phosphatase
MGLRECLLFDLDGTILDSLPGIEFSVRAAFESCGIPLHRDSLRQMIGPPIRTILSRAGNVEDQAALDELEGAFRRSYDTEGWRRTECFPGAQVTLRTMSQYGHRLFVVSNKPRYVSVQILECQGLLDLFREIVTSDSRTPLFRGKAEMIDYLTSKHNIAQESCLLVGDTIEDAQAAAATGIGFVYMTHGYGVITGASAVSCMFRLDGFREFLPMVTQEPVCDR